jgi:hypothetical protein
LCLPPATAPPFRRPKSSGIGEDLKVPICNMEVARVRVRDRSEVTPGGPERSPLGGFNSALDALLASLQLAAGHGLDDDIALLLLRPELKPGNPPRSP